MLKTWISSKCFVRWNKVFLFAEGGWWSPSQLLVVNKASINILMISGFSTFDCLLSLTFSLRAFFNASTLCFQFFIFLETLGVVEFFFVLLICVVYFNNVFSSYKCIFIVANSNFLPLAFKRPFFTFVCLLFFQYYFKQSLNLYISNFTAWATLCFILRQRC